MARGYLFEVSKNVNRVYSINSNYFANKIDAIGVESIKDDESANHTKDLILGDLVKTGAKRVGSFGIKMNQGNKSHFFLNRFYKFKDACNISLKEFCNDVSMLEQLLNDRNGDLVYDVDTESIYTWDNWIRQIEENCVYYFGNVMIIK